MENFDLVIVGAGLFGLTVARTYISLHPDAKVVVFENSDSIGGVWARHRLYPTLKTNNFLGTYELSDFPMGESHGTKFGSHISGEAAHSYLDCLAEKFDLKKLVSLNTVVHSAEFRQEQGWLLKIQVGGAALKQVLARKLILATGLTSEPQMPEVPGSRSFGGPFIHAKDILSNHEELMRSSKIVVVGGSKSSWDAAYLYASLGLKVQMLIRRNGYGPAWMAPPLVTPWKYPIEKLVHTRFLTLLSPCSWGEADGYQTARWFLHGTPIGRLIVMFFWWFLSTEVILMNGYRKDASTRKLEPWANTFWTGASGRGLLNYDTDFFEYVRKGQISVQYGEVKRAAPYKLYLDDDSELAADSVIFCTGWKSTPPMEFLPHGIEADLGFPGPHAVSTLEEQLSRQADEQLMNKFPRLRNPPGVEAAKKREASYKAKGPKPRPFRLYRTMIPPALAKYRNFGFAGMLTSISTPMIAQAQSLWLTAFLDGTLSLEHCLSRHYGQRPEPVKTKEEFLLWDAIYHSQFTKRRYPTGAGARHADFVFDAIPFLDMLLGDLGLRTHRKPSGLSEVFQKYGPQDYCGLLEEWAALRGVNLSEKAHYRGLE